MNTVVECNTPSSEAFNKTGPHTPVDIMLNETHSALLTSCFTIFLLHQEWECLHSINTYCTSNYNISKAFMATGFNKTLKLAAMSGG
jgi:hypothetical protein